MKNFLLTLWKDEEGAETVEYIFIVVIILAIAIAAYAGNLQLYIQNAIASIGAALETKSAVLT